MEIWNYLCNMSRSEFWGYYTMIGLINWAINAFVRKLETYDSPMFAFMWTLAWWLTPIGYIARGIEWTYNKIKSNQPLRRMRIFYLRNF